MLPSPDASAGLIVCPVVFAIVGVLWLRAKDGAPRLGGLPDWALLLGVLAAGLSLLFSPWKMEALPQTLVVFSAAALVYLLQALLKKTGEKALRVLAIIGALGLLTGALFSTRGDAAIFNLLLLGLSFALLLALPRFWKLPALAACFFCFFMLAKSGRASVLLPLMGFAIGCLYIARTYRWLTRRQLTAVAFALCAGVFALFGAAQRASDGTRLGLSQQQQLTIYSELQAAWLLGNERALTGWGLSNYKAAFPKVAAQTPCPPPQTPAAAPSAYAQLFAEAGAPGLMAALWFFWVLLLQLRAYLKTAPARDGRFACALGGLLGLSLVGLLLLATPVPSNPLALWACAIALGLAAAAKNPADCFSRRTGRLGALACFGLCAGIVGTLFLRELPVSKEAPLAAITRSLKKNPWQPQQWIRLAMISLDNADYTHARIAAEKAYLLNPNDKTSLLLLADIAERQQQPEQALVLLALEIINDPAVLLSVKDAGTRERIAHLARPLLAQLQKDFPPYAQKLSYTDALIEWLQTATLVATFIAPEPHKKFWAGDQPAQLRAQWLKTLDSAEHYTAPDELKNVFPRRGYLPPGIRLPLYEALCAKAEN